MKPVDRKNWASLSIFRRPGGSFPATRIGPDLERREPARVDDTEVVASELASENMSSRGIIVELVNT